jgi:hypothetical protein
VFLLRAATGERAAAPARATPSASGCCIKPSRKSCSALAGVSTRAPRRDDIATDRMRATDEMAVFGAHRYKRSSELAGGLCNSHWPMQ